YRGAGFAGIAAFLFAAPLLLLIGSPRRILRGGFWIVSGMLLLLAARMVWLGSELALALGAALVIAYSLALEGRRPYLFDVLVRMFQLAVAGAFGLAQYGQILNSCAPRLPRLFWLNVCLPIGAVVLFGTLFVLANPDVVKMVTEGGDRLVRWLLDWEQQLAQ